MDLKDLLSKTVGTKEKPANPWVGVIYTILSILGIALAALPVILARRKAAKVAHERDVLLAEREDAKVKKEEADIIAEKTELEEEVARIEDKLADLTLQIAGLHNKRRDFTKAISEITEWKDLGM